MSRFPYLVLTGALVLCAGGAAVHRASAQTALDAPPPLDARSSSISRGHYLAIAADCAACHTNGRNGQFMAGGYAILSPMGAIYSANITPSKRYGIGNYSLKQFSDALRKGVRRDGAQLYPAMPYDAYGRLTDADVKSLYDYMMTEVKPVDVPAPKTQLPFPFSFRPFLSVWKIAASVQGKPYVFDHSESDDWNRGKYLVDELAHCGTCHTPRNMLLVPKRSGYLSGAQLGAWYAPNITDDPVSGIGTWKDADLFAYLTTGRSPHARANGPMAEAVEHSLQYLPDADINAIIIYLRSVPPIAQPGNTVPAFAHPALPSGYRIDQAFDRRSSDNLAHMKDGAALYEAACASCHQSDGKGTADGYYPSLAWNTTTGQQNTSNLVSSIVYGVDRVSDRHEIVMPAFGKTPLVQPLDNQQIASIADYVLSHFGNAEASVSVSDVEASRAGGKPVLISLLINPVVGLSLIAGGLAALVLSIVIILRVVRRRHAARRSGVTRQNNV